MPGKQTLVSQLQMAAGAPPAAAAKRRDPLQTAAAGVAAASEPLPHGRAIQIAFGRHDIGSVRAAIGGPAQEASRSLGATAYATGDRVGFASAPDLHTAAHEAAHVVQQRSGVALAGGVGRSGDPYERHADRVADLVVRGESAEAALGELSGGGAPARAVQRHDSPNHIAIGDSVTGDAIAILGVEFSAGECAALVDYVGPLPAFAQQCERDQARETPAQRGETVRRLEAMRAMLQAGDEDTLMWDEVTQGRYSAITEDNQDHFAPDETVDAPNHSGSFVTAFTAALVDGAAGELERGRMHMYTAEHYLQDMFSSGHLVAQPDIDAAIDELLTGNAEVAAMMPVIASSVYDLGADIVSCYAIAVPGRAPVPLDRWTFIGTVFLGTLMKNGQNALVRSSLRRFVHEQCDAGVEVTSPAHPEPWIMQGDHALTTEAQQDNVRALQQALADVRDLFDRNAAAAVRDPEGQAMALLAHHKPVPTQDGEAVIAAAIAKGTASRLLFMNAMVEAGHGALAGALDAAVGMMSGGLVRLRNPGEPLGPADEVPTLDRSQRDPDERFVPEDRPSYFESRDVSPAAVQLAEAGIDADDDHDADRDVDVDVDSDADAEAALVIEDPVAGFTLLGRTVHESAADVGDSLELDCVVRLPVPLTSVVWVIGGFKVSAEHDDAGYALTMTGNLGLALSPAAGVFFELGTRITVDGKAADAQRAAEMLGLGLETYVRSFGTLPLGAALPGPALADAIWGRGHVNQAVGHLEDGDGFGVRKGAEGGMRMMDPATGIELKGRGGIAEQHEISKDTGEKGVYETSDRVFFEGELDFGPIAFGGAFDFPLSRSDPRTGTFSGAAKAMFEVGDPRSWIAGLAGAIGSGCSALLRAVSTHAASSPDALAFARSLSALTGTLEAAIDRVLGDAVLTLPGLNPGAGSKSGIEVVVKADEASGAVSLTASTVIESSAEEPVSGNKLEVAKKSAALGPIEIAKIN